jgi:hypothetical protein
LEVFELPGDRVGLVLPFLVFELVIPFPLVFPLVERLLDIFDILDIFELVVVVVELVVFVTLVFNELLLAIFPPLIIFELVRLLLETLLAVSPQPNNPNVAARMTDKPVVFFM